MLLAGVAIVIWTVSKIESRLSKVGCVSTPGRDETRTFPRMFHTRPFVKSRLHLDKIVETQRKFNTSMLSTWNRRTDSAEVFKVGAAHAGTLGPALAKGPYSLAMWQACSGIINTT